MEVGNAVQLTANAEKGSQIYEYEFYVIRDGKEILLRSYGSSNTYKWQPFTSAEYTVGVRVKDSSGTVVNKELHNYRVTTGTLSIEALTSSVEQEIFIGDTTVLTAYGTGGIMPYEYKFYVVRDQQEIVLQDYSEKNSYAWSPFTPADYQVHVSLRDASGEVVDKSISMTVKSSDIVIEELLVNNGYDTVGYVGENVYISTKAKGGRGTLEYRYYVIRDVDGREVQLRDFSEESVYIWGPLTPMQYTVCVEVKDSYGQTAVLSKEFEIRTTDFSITNFSASKAESAYAGDNILLTAGAAGGGGKYQYKFYVIRNDVQILLKDYSALNSYTWVPITPAEYYVCVDVKDQESGIVLTQMFHMSIGKERYLGIDVSAWQGSIDWKQVKDYGVDFAMLRILSGTMSNLTVDPYFYSNIKNATANGIAVGVYRYGYASNVEEAKKEAYMVVDALKSSGCNIQYPVAYDVEDEAAQGGLSKSELTAIINAFKNIIEANGYKFMIYANKNWLENKIDMSSFSQEDVWIAQYRDYTPDLGYQYNGPGNVTIWQYSSRGKVPGISGNVDMNIGYKKYS